MAQDRSFIERFRAQLIWGGIIAGVVVIAAFVLISASQPAYACSIQIDPAATAAPGTSVTGQSEDDMGRTHVVVGTPVTYTFCPPASGKHYNAAGQGPIAPRFYGPEDQAIPEGWVHNLEHGGLVVLYNCSRNGCDTNSQTQLRQLASNFPTSPRCGIPGGLLSPVIARFDQMKSPFAAIVWDRVLFQDTLNTAQILEFFKNVGELANPEQQPQCQTNPSASIGPSNPANPEPTNPAIQPAGSASAAPGSASGSSAAASAPASAAPPSASAAPSST